MAKLFTCAMCGKRVPQDASYIVRIEVISDPTVPPVTTGSMPDASEELERLIDQINSMSADELEDQVYRKMEFRLCSRCQPFYLAKPIQRRRSSRASHN
jgi:hypothetical protein